MAGGEGGVISTNVGVLVQLTPPADAGRSVQPTLPSLGPETRAVPILRILRKIPQHGRIYAILVVLVVIYYTADLRL